MFPVCVLCERPDRIPKQSKFVSMMRGARKSEAQNSTILISAVSSCSYKETGQTSVGTWPTLAICSMASNKLSN